MAFSGSARVFVPSSEQKSRQMTFVQAQQACFAKEREGTEDDRIARRLKEENDSRVDAILDAEARRRKENQAYQDRAETPPNKTTDQRMNALQRLRSMEWKRNQQDHVKIAREQVVRYEEVKSQRVAEEVFFEGTRQNKTKSRRKFRKEEVIHSFDEIASKSTVPQERRRSPGPLSGRRSPGPAVSKKLPQPPQPPGNVWLQKKGSELFGSLGLTPGSAEEEDEALRKALAASMQSFYDEQRSAELAITRSMPIGGKNNEEKKNGTVWGNKSSYASESHNNIDIRKSDVYSSLSNDTKGYEDTGKKFAYNFLPENTNHVNRNSRIYSGGELTGNTEKSKNYFWANGRTSGHEKNDNMKSVPHGYSQKYKEQEQHGFSQKYKEQEQHGFSQKYKEQEQHGFSQKYKEQEQHGFSQKYKEQEQHDFSQKYKEQEQHSFSQKYNEQEQHGISQKYNEQEQHGISQKYKEQELHGISQKYKEQEEIDDEEWDEEQEEFQESNMHNDRAQTNYVSAAPEPDYDEPVVSQVVEYSSLENDSSHFTSSQEYDIKETHGSERESDFGQYQDGVPTTNTTHIRRTFSSCAELPSSKNCSEPSMDSSQPASPIEAQKHFSRTPLVSLDSDEKQTEKSCKDLEESTVDPSCFMAFAPVRSGDIRSDGSETNSPAPVTSPSTDRGALVNGVPSPQPAAEPNPVLTPPYQEQYTAQLSELSHTLASLKLQMQAYPSASIPRQPQPYAFMPGNLPRVPAEMPSPEAYLSLLSMYNPVWQQAHGQGMFQAGAGGLDPRMQAAQLGMYACNSPEGGLVGGSPAGMPLMQDGVPSQQFPLPGVPSQQFPLPGVPSQQFPLPGVPSQQFPLPGMFMHPTLYPTPRPAGVDPRLFQDAMHQQMLSRLSPLRPPDVSSVPFLDPRMVNPHMSEDQNVPVTSAAPQDALSAFLYAHSLPFTSSNSSFAEGGKGQPPSSMHQHPNMTFPQAQSFVNEPVGVNGVEEHLPFPLGMQQPHVNSPSVPFQPPPEPEVGRGRGRLRH